MLLDLSSEGKSEIIAFSDEDDDVDETFCKFVVIVCWSTRKECSRDRKINQLWQNKNLTFLIYLFSIECWKNIREKIK